jgi:hypothetical protein
MMLPRQNNKNVLKINIDKDDDAEDIQKKREDAQRSYGIIDTSETSSSKTNNGSIVLGNKRYQNSQPNQSSLGNINTDPPMNINSTQPISIKQPNLNNSNAMKINMANTKKLVYNNSSNSNSNSNGNFYSGGNRNELLDEEEDYQVPNGYQQKSYSQQPQNSYGNQYHKEQYSQMSNYGGHQQLFKSYAENSSNNNNSNQASRINVNNMGNMGNNRLDIENNSNVKKF